MNRSSFQSFRHVTCHDDDMECMANNDTVVPYPPEENNPCSTNVDADTLIVAPSFESVVAVVHHGHLSTQKQKKERSS